ncbi:ribosome silencing factor [Jannaschia sp. M317]|nr:ribosome silencing factor [Jannaschia sp. M317]
MPLTEEQTLSADTIAAQSAATTGRQGADRSDEILALILKSLDDDKAEDVVQIDLRGKSSVADWMVVCSGRSSRQVAAISEKLSERLKGVLGRAARTEGKGQGDWVLLDAGDVIVHIFRPEVREFYQLEKMWQDPSDAAPRPN